jgi:hypothetical protein
MLAQEQATKLITAMMGKCYHEWEQVTVCRWKCKHCGKPVFNSFGQYPNRPKFSPSPDGVRVSYEIIDFMAKEFPEVWNKYLWGAWDVLNEGRGFLLYQEALSAQLSLTNLAQYIKDNYKKMFYEECYCNHCKRGGIQYHYTHPCEICGGVGGLKVNPKFEKVVKLLKEWNDE